MTDKSSEFVPFEIKGDMRQAKTTFYNIAQAQIRYLNENEMAKWQADHGRPGKVTTQSYSIGYNNRNVLDVDEEVAPLVQQMLSSNDKTVDQVLMEFGDKIYERHTEKWINQLDIVVNKDLFEKIKIHTGIDYTDIIPYGLDHEIFEAWLIAKKGIGSTLSINKKHLLARRREFLLAEKDGKGEKLFQFHMMVNPFAEKEYEYAWDKAKQRVGKV